MKSQSLIKNFLGNSVNLSYAFFLMLNTGCPILNMTIIAHVLGGGIKETRWFQIR